MSDSIKAPRRSGIRVCKQCEKELPNTSEYFHYANAKTGQVRPVCIDCRRVAKTNRAARIEEMAGRVSHLECPQGARLVPLAGQFGHGRAAIVDTADYDEIIQHLWCLTANGYATSARQGKINGLCSFPRLMHRFIMGESELVADHINRNRLDNRRCNLRYATNSQNAANAKIKSSNTSGFRGVWWNRNENAWQAEIKVDGHRQYLGVYVLPEEAAAAYDVAAFKIFGEYASLNFPR